MLNKCENVPSKAFASTITESIGLCGSCGCEVGRLSLFLVLHTIRVRDSVWPWCDQLVTLWSSVVPCGSSLRSLPGHAEFTAATKPRPPPQPEYLVSTVLSGLNHMLNIQTDITFSLFTWFKYMSCENSTTYHLSVLDQIIIAQHYWLIWIYMSTWLKMIHK